MFNNSLCVLVVSNHPDWVALAASDKTNEELIIELFSNTDQALERAIEPDVDAVILDLKASGNLSATDFVSVLALRYSKSVLLFSATPDDGLLTELRNILPFALLKPPLSFNALEFALRAAQSVRIAEQLKTGELERATEIIIRQTGEMLDSLRSAKTIQQAILPTESQLMRVIPDSFVLNLPKESLGGDFFWFNRLDHQKFAMAAIDCTGHGVPGALMSILVNNELGNMARESKFSLQQAFLKLNNFLLQADREVFNDRGDAQSLHAGFDAAAAVIDLTKNELLFSGARRPLWLWRSGELIEIKGHRHSVGLFDHDEKIYGEHCIPLEKGDTFYLFSDGFADQFGGDGTERYKTKRFRELLTDINNLSMAQQASALRETFRKWRGISEQTDDVLVVGVRV
jgi:serine phosphatase RsbU (regulator of sigma subunit)